MVSIPELTVLGQKIWDNDIKIEHILYAVSEDHAVAKLSDKSGVCLLILYPSADRQGGQNEGVDANTTWLFFLEKDVDGQTQLEENAQYERLRLHTVKARDYIEEKSVIGQEDLLFLNRHQPSRTQIIPEYREFGGFNGWSMSMVF